MGRKTEIIVVRKITDLPKETVLSEVRVSYKELKLDNGVSLNREGQIVLPWGKVIDETLYRVDRQGILYRVDREGNCGDGSCEAIKADIERITFSVIREKQNTR